MHINMLLFDLQHFASIKNSMPHHLLQFKSTPLLLTPWMLIYIHTIMYYCVYYRATQDYNIDFKTPRFMKIYVVKRQIRIFRNKSHIKT